ncbi:MAG TPA: flavodoxin domain-containing protein [Candidatus Bathyarchaeia archaeon]|nr:flavodoxin domain-containing protein [Candidatus Bathyarchaeia archaeon]
MPKKVLIAYGSRYGSTSEIASAMAQTFEKEGLEPQLLDLEQTKQQQWPSLTSFDSVLVGSGIRMSRWTRSATKFLTKHTDEIKTLKSKGLVLGVFVSCGMASTPGKQEEARQKYVGKILDEDGISGAVDAYDAFGGVYDLSPSARMGFLDKRMLSMAAKQLAKDGVSLKEGTRNDLRDWDQIQAFTSHVAQLIKQENKLTST